MMFLIAFYLMMTVPTLIYSVEAEVFLNTIDPIKQVVVTDTPFKETKQSYSIKEKDAEYIQVVVSLKDVSEDKFRAEVNALRLLYSGKDSLFKDTLHCIYDMQFRVHNQMPLETELSKKLFNVLGKEDQEKLCDRLRKAHSLAQQKPTSSELAHQKSQFDGLQAPVGVLLGAAIVGWLKMADKI